MDYNIFCVSDLRTLAKDRGLQGYSKLRKVDLTSLLRFHDASNNRTSTTQKQFNPEESDNEDDNPTKEGAKFDPEELDNEEAFDKLYLLPPYDDTKTTA